jgi:hypothetical protein
LLVVRVDPGVDVLRGVGEEAVIEFDGDDSGPDAVVGENVAAGMVTRTVRASSRSRRGSVAICV